MLQLALLLSYFTAHWLNTRPPRTQATVYVALLVLSLAQLAATVHIDLRASSAHPIASVLWLLTALIGLPFVTLSASGPLLQAWCARTVQQQHPYRLYVVSNVGSLLALLVYPWLIEPRASISQQALLLAVGAGLPVAVGATVAARVRGPASDHVAVARTHRPPAKESVATRVLALLATVALPSA